MKKESILYYGKFFMAGLLISGIIMGFYYYYMEGKVDLCRDLSGEMVVSHNGKVICLLDEGLLGELKSQQRLELTDIWGGGLNVSSY